MVCDKYSPRPGGKLYLKLPRGGDYETSDVFFFPVNSLRIYPDESHNKICCSDHTPDVRGFTDCWLGPRASVR